MERRMFTIICVHSDADEPLSASTAWLGCGLMQIYVSIPLCVMHSNMCHMWVPDGQGPVVALAAYECMGEIDAANFIKDHEN